MNSYEKIIQKTMDLQREIAQANLTRRELLKMGLISATTGMLLPIHGLSLRAARADLLCPEPGKEIISPFTRPWRDEMPRLVNKQVVAGNNPANFSTGNGGGAPSPDPVGNANGGDSKIRLLQDFPALANATPYPNLSHQGWGKPTPLLGNRPPQKWYEMRQRQFNHVWHTDLPAGNTGNPAWGFDGMYPGPMFRIYYGEPHFVRIHNDLPSTNLGYGINQTATHLHNMHTPSESDGNPLYTNYSGHYWDHHYPNVYAGVKQFGGLGDPNEALGSLWYHDHKLDFTAQNIYAGLAGMACVYDASGAYADPTKGDYGDETKGWRLPSGYNYEFDVGLLIMDRQFDPNGEVFFPVACRDGVIGDKVSVNGKIQPFFPVKRRKYRFRMLNIGPSRSYLWFLSNGQQFTVVSNDGNLLPAPIKVSSFRHTPAERVDIILDFSTYAPGTEIILVNRAEQRNGRGPTGALLTPGDQVLKFIVGSEKPVDNSIIPIKLRPLPNISQPVSKDRSWVFSHIGNEWTINDLSFDRNIISALIPEGTAERWTLTNGGGSWQHPIHPHYEEHRLLTYNGQGVPPIEQVRKDVLRLDPNAVGKIYMRFRDYKGLYVMHCHNLVHEDHSMMIQWKIV